MLTEKALWEIQQDLEMMYEAVVDKTGHAGGEDPPGMEIPGMNDDDDEKSNPSTEGSIKALAGEDFKEKDDFFKLSQILKGLAAVSDKDQAAKDFLTKIGEAVRSIAGGGTTVSKNDKRTEPNDEEPLKGHPDREKQPDNKASQTDVEKGLPGSTET